MTGRYPFHLGMQHFTTLVPGSEAKLPTDQPTIGEIFKEAGYHTMAVGKWHLGYSSWDYTPTGRGFDTYTGYLQGQCDYYNKSVGGGGHDFWHNRSFFADAIGDLATKTKYSMGYYENAVSSFIDTHKDDPENPIFLYYAHQEIHIPLDLPPGNEYVQPCAKVKASAGDDAPNRYILCAMMHTLDTAIGDFVTYLKGSGLWENTLLWVTTDNGGMAQVRYLCVCVCV